MLSPSDPLYKECCSVLRKEYELTELETFFCEWVGQEFGIQPPIHIVAETNPHGRHYLNLAVRTWEEAKNFWVSTETLYARDEQKQARILHTAKETGFLNEVAFVSKRGKWWRKPIKPFFQKDAPDRNPAGWYVHWSAFNPIAIEEALSKVSPACREQLMSVFSEDGLMFLKTVFSGTVMMFETEAQRIVAEQNGTQSEIAKRWREAVLPFDEFGVLANTDLHIKFDSNEVFQRDYKGSWFSYTR